MVKTLGLLVAVIALVGGGIWYIGESHGGGENLSSAVGNATTTMSTSTITTGTITTTTPTSTISTSTRTGVATTTASVKSFTITGSNFSFIPTTITVSKGDRVRITLKNTGGLHDLKIDAFNVATAKLNGGSSETIEFVADKAGSFEYYCSVGNNRALGMKGTLVVN